jgi:EAL domain-containing protein (putative c-di-GMP-specific phosphodiesterase class I)
MPLSADVAQTYRTRELIDELIADPRQLGPDYAPIHSLATGALVGYKATGRGAEGTDLADTLSLLDGARSLGLVERLDWAFRALAVEDLLPTPSYELHLTPEPETYGTACPPRLAGLMGRARKELSVAAEVHGEAFEPGVRLDAGIEQIRSWGWKVVLADVADDDRALVRAAEIHPDVVQIDLRLAGRGASDEHHGVERLLALVADSGAALMAVGVDVPSARDRAITLGASLVRGDLYGAPGSLPSA